MVCVALHAPVHSPQATEHVTPHDGNKQHRSNRQGVDPTSTLCPVLPMHRLPSETRGIFNLPVLDAYLPAGRTVPQTQYLATALNYLAASPTSWIGSAALPHDLHLLPQRDLGPKRDLGATTSDCGRHRHATFCLPRSPILPWYVAQMSFVAACGGVSRLSRWGRAFHVCSGGQACLPILRGFVCRMLGGRRLLSPIPSDAGWTRVVGHDCGPGARYRRRCQARPRAGLPRGWVAPQNR